MPEMETEFGHLVEMIISVESGWDSKAVGDQGNAVGVAQIWKVVVDDVNRFSGKAFTYRDRLDPRKSREMIQIYLDHYAQAYKKATGKKAGMETLARIWNGGPDGYKKGKTAGYWQKIKSTILDPL
ncbi:MAG: transglycosylase SLT domain-containing protein, partial [Patescibacteria group bacterium]